MDEFLEKEGKLGHGFTSADLLEEIDIGDGDRPRPTFISVGIWGSKNKNFLQHKPGLL